MEFFLQSTPPNAVATHAHIHDSIELLYAKSGRFTVFLDGREYLFSAGDLILFCSNSIHHISSGDGAEHQYYVIKVDPTLLLELAGTVQGTAYLMRFSEGGSERRCYWSAESLEGSPILQALRALIAEYASEHYARELAMKLHAAELLLAILRDGGERREAGIERGVYFFSQATSVEEAEEEARFVLDMLGGEPLDGQRHLWWNFVSSSKERIEQAKQDWLDGRFGRIEGDDEFIPLPQR
jgi:hypothetical protein